MPDKLITPRKSRSQDISGRKFNRLTAIRKSGYYVYPSGKREEKWECQCDCGNVTHVHKIFLTTGHTSSCGCYRIQRATEALTKHGHCPSSGASKMYYAFKGAMQRCTNPKVRNWEGYGGRGIKFLWKSFHEFLKEMQPTWKPGLSLDRINNDGHYEPGNCKWSTRKEQGRNRRNNRIVEFEGRSMTVAGWSEIVGLSQSIINSRLNNKWPIRKALTQPPHGH